MALNKSVATFMLATVAIAAGGVEYEVGDSAGWTAMGRVDYQGWASTKNFHAGDTLIFNYNNQFHNVKQVTLQDFESCNRTSPIATYNNGSDTITLDKSGHYYFICAYPGHCQAGQKVHVFVSLPSPNPSPAPTTSTSSSGSSTTYHYSSGALATLGALASSVFVLVV